MRISAFLMSYPPERYVGAELMTATILEKFVDAGHEVTVYADLITEAFTRNGVHVKPRSSYDKLIKTAHLVISHPDLGTIGYLAARLHRIPYVAIVHNTGSLNTWHLGHHKPDLVVWNAESTRAAHNGKGGLIVHSPLTVSDYQVKKTGEHFTLINLTKSKGVDTFLALVKATDFPALAIAGGYGEQAMGACKKAGAKTHSPISHEEMGKTVWSKTKVLLVPSDNESWGRVAAEAMCSGIPVIAHPTPGLLECLGEAGIFIDREDIESWTAKLSELMTNPVAYAAAAKLAKGRARQLEQLSQQQLTEFIRTAEQLAHTYRI